MFFSISLNNAVQSVNTISQLKGPGFVQSKTVFLVDNLNDSSTDGADEWAGPPPLQHGERSEATAVRPLPGKRQ
jgi:hypothetical protein